MKPILTGFSQLAYTTNDIDRAMEIYATRYGVPSFHRFDTKLDVLVGNTEGSIELKIALANVEGVNIELMQAIRDLGGFFTSSISGKTGFAVALHHVAQRIEGNIANWDAHAADLENANRDITLKATAGDHARIVFTDDRDMIGAYIEHIWMTPEARQELDRLVPFHGAVDRLTC